MDSLKQEKIQRFLSDRVMCEAVYDVLLQAFLKKRPDADINIIASSMLAVYSLDDAWKELGKFRSVGTTQKKELDQVGL